MANLPVPAGAESIPRGKFAALKRALVAAGVWEAVTEAAQAAPGLWNDLVGSMTGSGVKPEDLSKLSGADSRRVVLVELARAGLPLSESAGLTSDELKKYFGMLKEFGAKLQEEHDGSQVERPSSGDEKIDQYAFHRALGRTANRLGLSGPGRFRQLYEIAQVLNSITEADVESVELFELNFPNALRG